MEPAQPATSCMHQVHGQKAAWVVDDNGVHRYQGNPMGQVRRTRPRLNAVRPGDRKGFVPLFGQTTCELKRAVTGMIPFTCSQNATLGRIVGSASDDIHVPCR